MSQDGGNLTDQIYATVTRANATVQPQQTLPWYSDVVIITLITVIVIAAVIATLAIWKFRGSAKVNTSSIKHNKHKHLKK